MGWQDEVLGYWFALSKEQWWKADPALDSEIRERFLDLWEEKRENMPEAFLGSARDSIAAIILFDQFPRNMHRGHADQFSTDPLALAIAKGARRPQAGRGDEPGRARLPLHALPAQRAHRGPETLGRARSPPSATITSSASRGSITTSSSGSADSRTATPSSAARRGPPRSRPATWCPGNGPGRGREILRQPGRRSGSVPVVATRASTASSSTWG